MSKDIWWGVFHDDLAALYNGKVGESELIWRLDEAHAVASHVHEGVEDADTASILLLFNLKESRVRMLKSTKS